MTMCWRKLLVMAVWVSVSRAQLPGFGSCPSVPVVRDFDVQRYMGRWYELEKYFSVFELGGQCITADYQDLGNGKVKVTNSQQSYFFGQRTSIDGEADLVGTDGEAKLSVTFAGLSVNRKAPYWVIDTDYDNYSIVWSCSNFGFFNTQNMWLLSRKRKPEKAALRKAYAAIDKSGLSRSSLSKTTQTNCKEDETPTSDAPTVLDEPIVTNINITRPKRPVTTKKVSSSTTTKSPTTATARTTSRTTTTTTSTTTTTRPSSTTTTTTTNSTPSSTQSTSTAPSEDPLSLEATTLPV